MVIRTVPATIVMIAGPTTTIARTSIAVLKDTTGMRTVAMPTTVVKGIVTKVTMRMVVLIATTILTTQAAIAMIVMVM